MATNKYRYRVTGPRGGKYLTTTRAEAEKLTRHGGSFRALGQKKASRVKNPQGVWDESFKAGYAAAKRLLVRVDPWTLDSTDAARRYKAVRRKHGVDWKEGFIAAIDEARGAYGQSGVRRAQRLHRNPLPWCLPPSEVSALFAEGRVSKGELREIYPEWFDGKGKQIAGFFRITVESRGADGKPIKVGVAIPLRAKEVFSRQWRGITKHWGFRKKESFADIKKALMTGYYFDVLELCEADHPHPYDAAITIFLGRMEKYTKR